MYSLFKKRVRVLVSGYVMKWWSLVKYLHLPLTSVRTDETRFLQNLALERQHGKVCERWLWSDRIMTQKSWKPLAQLIFHGFSFRTVTWDLRWSDSPLGSQWSCTLFPLYALKWQIPKWNKKHLRVQIPDKYFFVCLFDCYVF